MKGSQKDILRMLQSCFAFGGLGFGAFRVGASGVLSESFF